MVLLLNWQISWVILYQKIQKMYLLPGLAVQRMSTYRAGATENKLNIHSQVAKGSDLYRADKSTKLCMVVA